jgi:hypothetical protein
LNSCVTGKLKYNVSEFEASIPLGKGLDSRRRKSDLELTINIAHLVVRLQHLQNRQSFLSRSVVRVNRPGGIGSYPIIS